MSQVILSPSPTPMSGDRKTQINITNIPAELKSLPNWVLWKYDTRESKDGERKTTKVPLQSDLQFARTNDPTTWTTFEAAWEACQQYPFIAGIGFCLPLDGSIVGGDCDHVIKGEVMEPWAKELVEQLDTYIEKSPSGTGLRFICRANRTGGRKKFITPETSLEIYGKGSPRFLTFTGNYIKNVGVNDQTDELNEILAQLHYDEAEKPKSKTMTTAKPCEVSASDKYARCIKALNKTPVTDNYDGSRRLIIYAGKCVFFDLPDQQAIAAIRCMPAFPRDWSDSDILTRLRDAEKHGSRGAAYTNAYTKDHADPDDFVNWTQYCVDPNNLIVTDWETVIGDVEWFWDKRIPYEGTTLLAGEAGISKSTVALALAAACSTGGDFPSGDKAPLGDVLVFTAEDPDKVVKSRLLRLGADLKRVHKIEGRKSGSVEKYFDLKDIVTLQAALQRWPETKLIIIDPVASYVDKVDTHKNSEVRGVLKPLNKLLERHKLAALLVIHLNKDETKSASNRITGSSAWRDNARAAWFVVKDKQEENKRFLMPDKQNYAEKGNGFIYTLNKGQIEWAGETTMRLQDLMRYEPPANKTDVAGDWLRERLKDGEVLQSEIERDAVKMGFSEFTLRAAKKNIGAKAVRKGFGGAWTWSLQDNHKSENDPFAADDRPF